MKKFKRRDFLHTAAGAAGLAWAYKYCPVALGQSADARIDVLLDEPLGTISPNIYGHFAEHLGGLGPLSLPDETLSRKVATDDAHVHKTRHALLLLCGDINHSSRTNGNSRKEDRLACLAK